MKKYFLIITTLLFVFCLAGCAVQTNTPPTNVLTSEQKSYLTQMSFPWPAEDDEIIRLASFPDSSYDGTNYRLSIKAIVADYNFKYLLVGITPISDEAKKTFADFKEFPNLYVADNLSTNRGNSASGFGGSTDEKLVKLCHAVSGNKGYLYLKSDLPKNYLLWYNPDRQHIISYSLPVDLSSVITAPLEFDCTAATEYNGCTLKQLKLCATTIEAVFTISSDLLINGNKDDNNAIRSAVQAQSITLTDKENNIINLPLDGSGQTSSSLTQTYNYDKASYKIFCTIPVINLEDIGNLQINGQRLEIISK